ncbi:S-adenosyl-L-methionine-dependent methyltransferase [Xylaria sp. CBS 124048]|nr:S-adenosyl-L-methionine-dependent methyltransferase [Xylaria sp. CBS 124048]
MVTDFEKQSYWHTRFATETSFEWLTSSPTFLTFVTPYLVSPAQRILHLGSGTSDLHAHLRAKGYLDVTNIDYEPLALTRGRQIEEDAFGDIQTKYLVADVTSLSVSLPARSFDLVVDKSTIDAVSCGGDDAVLSMARCVRECLTADGVWISLSFSATRFELDGMPFTVDVLGKIPTPKRKPLDPDVFYWCYLLRAR